LEKAATIKNPLINRKPDEPAKLQPFHQLALGTDQIEKLQQHRPQQALPATSKDARSSGKTRKPLVRSEVTALVKPSHRAQRMYRWYPSQRNEQDHGAVGV
jgi:hypothetical protein